jgi:hypothetical protein
MKRIQHGLEMLRRCWTEDAVTFYGKRFSLAHVCVTTQLIRTILRHIPETQLGKARGRQTDQFQATKG